MAATPHDPRDALAQRIRTALASHRTVREVNMFGGRSFMVDERLAVAAWGSGELLVRVDQSRRDELLRQGATPAVMSNGRPMGRGWLNVPSPQLADDADLARWIQIGVDSALASTAPPD